LKVAWDEDTFGCGPRRARPDLVRVSSQCRLIRLRESPDSRRSVEITERRRRPTISNEQRMVNSSGAANKQQDVKDQSENISNPQRPSCRPFLISSSFDLFCVGIGNSPGTAPVTPAKSPAFNHSRCQRDFHCCNFSFLCVCKRFVRRIVQGLNSRPIDCTSTALPRNTGSF